MNNYKFRRIGSYIVDMTITQMFATVILKFYFKGVSLLFYKEKTNISIGDNIALPLLLIATIIGFIIVIAIHLLFIKISYKYLGTSFSKYFLRLTYISTNQEKIVVKDILKREREKIIVLIATLGLYPIYELIQYLAYNRVPTHVRRSNIDVV